MSSLGDNLDILFTKMEDFVTTKTVVGDPVYIGEIIIIPLVEVSVGVGALGSEEKGGKESGSGGLGARIIPSAILVINNGNTQLISVKNQDAINKLIDMAPGVISKLNFGAAFGKKKNVDDKAKSEEVKFDETIVVEE